MRQTATQFQMPGMANALSISSRRSFDTEPWAAFYCRLSQDDGLDGESNSIQHQKQILERYAKEHGIKKYKFYVDDGISGTTFNRPGFQEMLADIEAGYVYMGSLRRIYISSLSMTEWTARRAIMISPL